MPVLLLIAGLILRLTSGWFVDQHVVGDILIWGGVAMWVLRLPSAIQAVNAKKHKK